MLETINQVAKASSKQTEAVSEINKDIEEIAGLIQNMASSSEEAAATSEELSTQTDMLNDPHSSVQTSELDHSNKIIWKISYYIRAV